jgi:fructose-bisphosphate aldolase, class II
LPLGDNLRIAAELLELCARASVVLEIECGVVGGEEDGTRADGPRERRTRRPRTSYGSPR